MGILVGNMVGTAIDHSIRKNLHSGDSLSERETHSGYSSLWTTVKRGTHTVGTATYGQSIRKGNIHSGDSLSEKAIQSGYGSLWTTVKRGTHTVGTAPFAFGCFLQLWLQADQVVGTRTRVA